MIFGGCGNTAAKDAGPSEDRAGKSCYQTTHQPKEVRVVVNGGTGGGGSSNARTDDGFRLTMKAGTAASELDEMVELMTALRFEAASNAAHFHEQSCLESDQTAAECSATCAQMGLQWDHDAVVCELCTIHDDGTIDCPDAPPSLAGALSVPWYGDQPWVYQNEQTQQTVVVQPPTLQQNADGDFVWVSEVSIFGQCDCACTV